MKVVLKITRLDLSNVLSPMGKHYNKRFSVIPEI